MANADREGGDHLLEVVNHNVPAVMRASHPYLRFLIDVERPDQAQEFNKSQACGFRLCVAKQRWILRNLEAPSELIELPSELTALSFHFMQISNEPPTVFP
jgi:hypothetical protein